MVEERNEYWSSEIDFFFAHDRSLDELHSWLRNHNVYYTFEDSDIVDGKWRVGLEQIQLDGIVCEKWAFYLEVAVDDSREVQSHLLEQMGVCL